jgi:hypothetical protein
MPAGDDAHGGWNATALAFERRRPQNIVIHIGPNGARSEEIGVGTALGPRCFGFP